jgi:hypothetical protein
MTGARGAPMLRAASTDLETVMRRWFFADCGAAIALLCWSAPPVTAQTGPTEFPPEAVVPATEEVQALLANKVFRVTRADGNHWRLQFKDNGYYFINTAQGFADDGRWRVEVSRLCIEPRKGTAGCSEVRMVGGQLHLKRATNGEIVHYELQ